MSTRSDFVIVLALFSLLGIGIAKPQGKGKAQEPTPPPKPELGELDAKLRELAGAGAEFCGHVPIDGNSKAANDCVRKTFRKRRPFYVAYDTLYISPGDFYSAGLARDLRGKMWSVTFSSAELPRPVAGSKMRIEGHIAVEPCPRPYRLLEGRDGGAMDEEWKRGPVRVSCTLFGA